jgi:ribosomal protein S16
MTAKKISLKPKIRTPQDTAAMNAWVEQGAEMAAPAAKSTTEAKESMKRLSIDIPASLHRELMMYCVQNGTKAAQVVRGLLEEILHK